MVGWSWHRADTVCFACNGSQPNSVMLTMAKFLIEWNTCKRLDIQSKISIEKWISGLLRWNIFNLPRWKWSPIGRIQTPKFSFSLAFFSMWKLRLQLHLAELVFCKAVIFLWTYQLSCSAVKLQSKAAVSHLLAKSKLTERPPRLLAFLMLFCRQLVGKKGTFYLRYNILLA